MFCPNTIQTQKPSSSESNPRSSHAEFLSPFGDRHRADASLQSFNTTPCVPPVAGSLPDPPVALQDPFNSTWHNDTRVDLYFWMRLSDEQKEAEEPDEQTQRVVDYIEAENDYTEAVMVHTEDLKDILYNEMVNRKSEEESDSAPSRSNGYWYYSKFEIGSAYPSYYRKPVGEEVLFEDSTGTEELVLNVTLLAEGHDFFDLGAYVVSDDTTRVAFTVDTVGRRQYTIMFQDIGGLLYPEEIPNACPYIVWAGDNRTLFYVTNKAQTLRPYRVYRHELSASVDEALAGNAMNGTVDDVLVHEETDEMTYIFIDRTKSKDFIRIYSWQRLSDEIRVVDAYNPTSSDHLLIQARQSDLKYDVVHRDDYFYIRTNADNATNYQLIRTPANATNITNWETVIPHREGVFLNPIVEIFRDLSRLSRGGREN